MPTGESRSARTPRRTPAPLWAALVAALAAVVLVAAGCTPVDLTPPGGAAAVGSASDINPAERSALRPGGNLRLALTQFPPNFNPLHLDGNLAENAAMLKATMPRAFIIGADGSARVDHDYFTDIALTGTNPQIITYTINPKAVWSDGTPLTWTDIASQIHATSGADPAFAIATSSSGI